MKRIMTLCLALTVILSLSACSNKQKEHDIKIVVPAGSTEDFAYSDEEISPLKDKITICSGEGLGDTEVVLKAIQVTEETSYEPTYITPGMPVVMDVEKGGWFKVGVNLQNPTEEDITVYVTVKDVEVRIE